MPKEIPQSSSRESRERRNFLDRSSRPQRKDFATGDGLGVSTITSSDRAMQNLNTQNLQTMIGIVSHWGHAMEFSNHKEVQNVCEKLYIHIDKHKTGRTYEAYKTRHGEISESTAKESLRYLQEEFKTAKDWEMGNSVHILESIKHILDLQPASTSDKGKGSAIEPSDQAGPSYIHDTHEIQAIPERYQWGDQTKPGAYLSHKTKSNVQIFVPRDKGSSYDVKGSIKVMQSIDPTTKKTLLKELSIPNRKNFGDWTVNRIIQNIP